MYPTFGTDPEKLIRDEKGRPVPAHKFFPRQDEGIQLFDGGKAYRDGYMLEISVEPHYCRAVLTNRVRSAFAEALQKLPKGYSLDSIPAVKIDLDYLKEPGVPGDVLLFGCQPSINAYTLEAQVPAIDARTHPWRYGGTHMHCGCAYEVARKYAPWFLNDDNKILLVKMWDRYLGVPLSAALDSREQYRRRKWYGKAGEFRFQYYNKWSFGVEYRTPSQIFNNYGLASWSFGIMRWVWEHFLELQKTWDRGREEATRHAIDTGDGLLKLVESVLGYYQPETIHALRKINLKSFELVTQKYNVTQEWGWNEWAKNHEIPGG